MAILVTGGAGFIGSHLVDRLVTRGERVVVIDNLSSGRIGHLAASLATGRVTFAYGDIATADIARLWRDASTEPCTAVYHLASRDTRLTDGAVAWQTLRTHAIGTMAAIEFALGSQVRFVLGSSSGVYGDPAEHPQSESYFGLVDSIGTRAPDDEGVRFAEAAVASAISNRRLDGRIARIFTAYGPRMGTRTDRLVSALCISARDATVFSIHGDGEQTRSLTHVRDVVDGVLAVAQATERIEAPINIGSDEEKSVTEIVGLFQRVAGVELERRSSPARDADVRRQRPSLTRALALGWKPRVALTEGLRETYAWFSEEARAFA